MGSTFNKEFPGKCQEKEGQALVEYILMLVMGISLVIMFNNSFRTTVASIWNFYIRQISAACPGCPPNPSYRIR